MQFIYVGFFVGGGGFHLFTFKNWNYIHFYVDNIEVISQNYYQLILYQILNKVKKNQISFL